MLLHELEEKKLINPPKWLATNTHYLTVMGSVAYGVSSDSSDYDTYGFCVPPKATVFPHLAGEIPGFGTPVKRFDKPFSKHHVFDPDALGGRGREYDFTIYGIVRYFQLCMDNNPNMLDSLFTPANCVLHITKIGNMVREERHLFLTKRVFHSMKGYAYSQLSKAANTGRKNKLVQEIRAFEEENGIPHSTTPEQVDQAIKDGTNLGLSNQDVVKYRQMFRNGIEGTEDLKNSKKGSLRFVSRKTHNVDVKFLYHVVRNLSECEQILQEHDLDLQEKSRREHMKAIRRGDVTLEDVEAWFTAKEKQLERLYESSSLRYKPDESKIRTLLLNCLEEHYGSLDNAVTNEDAALVALREMAEVLEKHRRLLS